MYLIIRYLIHLNDELDRINTKYSFKNLPVHI